jgi:hypothetical protein
VPVGVGSTGGGFVGVGVGTGVPVCDSVAVVGAAGGAPPLPQADSSETVRIVVTATRSE